MQLFLDRIIDGVNSGVIYAFIALALVCVYRGTGHLNLAQGEMAMFCAFGAYALVQVGVPIIAAIAVVAVVGLLAGGILERVLIRPLGRGPASEYPILLVTIGVFLILNTGAGVIWGGVPLALPAVVPDGANDYLDVFGSRLHYPQLVIIGVLVVVLGSLYLLFRFTRIGLAMRATAGNPDAAVLLGIPVNRINSLGWMLAAGVGALLGPLVAPSTSLNTGMMFTFILYGAAAATLGGFDSPGGAVVGGLLIGVVENLLSSYVTIIGPDLKLAVALVILLVVLMVRPSGLFGTPRAERV